MNANKMIKNMNAWTADELQPYLGRYVAWPVDGKVILAASDDPVDMVKKLDEAGVDALDYIIDFIPEPEKNMNRENPFLPTWSSGFLLQDHPHWSARPSCPAPPPDSSPQSLRAEGSCSSRSCSGHGCR